MKQALSTNFEMFHKLGTIEKEIMELKLDILKKLAPIGKKTTSFKVTSAVNSGHEMTHAAH